MSAVLKGSTDPTVFLLSLPLDAGPAGVTPGAPLAVRWGRDAASAGLSSAETTVNAVRPVTTASHSASVIQYTHQPQRHLQVILWSPLSALRVISDHPPASNVCVMAAGQCRRCATPRAAACVEEGWRGSAAPAAGQDITPSLAVRPVGVMAQGLLPETVVPLASAVALPTTRDSSATSVLPVTTDTQTVPCVSAPGRGPMSRCVTRCLVSACVGQGWWVSSATAVPGRASRSPSAQPP